MMAMMVMRAKSRANTTHPGLEESDSKEKDLINVSVALNNETNKNCGCLFYQAELVLSEEVLIVFLRRPADRLCR